MGVWVYGCEDAHTPIHPYTHTAFPMTESDVPQLVDGLFRREAGRLVSYLTRCFGPQNLSMAEDVVQETLAKALAQWPYRGIPENPSGWLLKVARNRALDILRVERN